MFRKSFVLPGVAKRRRVSPWNKARTRYLRRRWSQGARVRDIAAELGHGITPNAVIAKIHRLGIADLSPFGGAPGRRHAAVRYVDKPDRIADWRRRGPPPAWVVNAKAYVEDARRDANIPRRRRRALLELTDNTCRWPVGDPRSSRFFFCGAPPAHNKPYCAKHCARAYLRPRTTPNNARAAARGDEPVTRGQGAGHRSSGERR
ncbi:MAG TPA: GcrA family cell cycle regulator [Xanthobacteraceae bacterium]